MAFLGNKAILKCIKDNKVIKPFNKTRIKNGAYELSLGGQVFLTNSKSKEIKKVEPEGIIHIEPGQFALLLTEETVKIPEDKIGFISIKAKIKFKGLVNVSGFHVDPDFNGQLLFSVYNAGPATITLKRGENYFPLWLAELSEKQKYIGTHPNQDSIPSNPIEALSQGEFPSPQTLKKEISDSNSRIAILEKDNKANNYIAITALGFVIALIIKFSFDFYALNKGWDSAIEQKERVAKYDSIINLRLLEKKKLIEEIDALTIKKDSLIKE